MASTPARIAALVRDWDGGRWSSSYAPGKWTASQLVLHLAHDEIGWCNRVRLALTVEGYVVQPYEGADWVVLESPTDPETALAAYLALRRLNLILYRRIEPERRGRPFAHPELGEISVDWILQTLAGHDLHHLRQLQAIAAAKDLTPRAQRLLLAVTRVPGSTRACAARGDAAFFDTLGAYYAVAAEAATAAAGRFVKAMGDSVLLSFPADQLDAATAALRVLQERGTTLWRQFDEGCHVQVKGRIGEVLVGLLGAPGEERFDIVGDDLNALFKRPWHDFDVEPGGTGG